MSYFQGPDWVFKTELPSWAEETWTDQECSDKYSLFSLMMTMRNMWDVIIVIRCFGRTLLENLINLLLNTHGLTTEYTDIGFPSIIITAMGIRWDFGPAPILKTFMWSIIHPF